MKKRSLFAAVAMLIVSAIVLTSATYAWFASGSASTVDAMAATVTNNDGSLLVAAKNQEGFWKTSLKIGDFTAAGYTYLESGNELYPVDCKLASLTSDPTFFGCDYDGYTFQGETVNTANFMDYTWYVKAVNKAGTIELAPSFNAGAGTGFVYGLVIVNGTAHVFGTSGDSYTPFDDSNIKATEGSTNNGIVDAGDTISQGQLAANAVTVTNDASISIEAAADTAYTVRCIIWAEGQDSGCAGSVSNTGAGFSFTPSFTPAP